MRSRSYKFTSKVVPPTAEPVPPATWNRGNSHILRSRRGPAAVLPRGIAWVPTQKQHQVFAGTWRSNHHGHVGVEDINSDISNIENQLLSLNTRPNSMRSNRYHCQWQLSHHRVEQ